MGMKKYSRRTQIGFVLIVALMLSGCFGVPSSIQSSSAEPKSLPSSSDRDAVMPSSNSVPPAKADTVLIVSPAKVVEDADKMEDAELLAMFENTLYKNGVDAFLWPLGEHGVKCEVNPPKQETWNKVTNITSLADLRLNYEAVYSKRLIDDVIYPGLFNVEHPAFKEIDGELHIMPFSGVGIGVVPDFENAEVVTKSADSFGIAASMIAPENVVEATFNFKVLKQDGNWVLDTFYLYNPDISKK